MYQRSCLTYFCVIYDENTFDAKDFFESLNLDYKIFERFGTNKSIEIGRNEIFDININEMVRVTLKDLFGKEEILLNLKKKYNLTYYLERVPSLVYDTDEPNQILSLEPDIVEFLYKSQTEDDLDYYIL